MANEKRAGEQQSQHELRAQLNEAQRVALGELELLGWSLKFVRKPLFQDPVPVVSCEDSTEIGILDAEGKIVVDKSQKFRDGEEPEPVEEIDAPRGFEPDAEPRPEVPPKPVWVEKRKGEAPIPDNLEQLLNGDQLTALRQIENFGWELKFVRRPLFQDPVAVIINDNGRVGTLESDGRIDLHMSFDMRSDAEDESAAGEAAAEPKHSK